MLTFVVTSMIIFADAVKLANFNKKIICMGTSKLLSVDSEKLLPVCSVCG